MMDDTMNDNFTGPGSNNMPTPSLLKVHKEFCQALDFSNRQINHLVPTVSVNSHENAYPEILCTFQSGRGIQKNSSCNTVETKLLFSAHDVSLHKLFHKLIITAQQFKEMPPGTLRMRFS